MEDELDIIIMNGDTPERRAYVEGILARVMPMVDDYLLQVMPCSPTVH